MLELVAEMRTHTETRMNTDLIRINNLQYLMTSSGVRVLGLMMDITGGRLNGQSNKDNGNQQNQHGHLKYDRSVQFGSLGFEGLVGNGPVSARIKTVPDPAIKSRCRAIFIDAVRPSSMCGNHRRQLLGRRRKGF